MERGGKKAAGVVAATALGQPAESRVAAAARSTGGVDRRAGPCGGRAGLGAAGSTAIDDASRRRTGYRAGVHADARAGRAFPAGQTDRQLPRTDSQRVFQRRRASSGSDTSANKAVRFCAACWWRRRRVRCGMSDRRAYQRLAQRKCRALAKVAMARKLAVRLYWMLRLQVNYAQLIQGSHAGQPGTFRGRG